MSKLNNKTIYLKLANNKCFKKLLLIILQLEDFICSFGIISLRHLLIQTKITDDYSYTN